MGSDNKEIELKLPITNKEEIIEKIEKLGATFISEVTQEDYLYNSVFVDFAKTDQVLRLRHEIGKDKKTFLTYKGPATYSPQGHKIRDEHEVKLTDFTTMQHILISLRFIQVGIVKKKRQTFMLKNLLTTIDTLSFGTFIEIEGDEKKSEALRKELGLSDVVPIKKGYFVLQQEWEKEIKR